MNLKVSKILKDIKTLKIQGAREVAKAGAEAIKLTALKSRAKTREDFVSELQEIGKKLSETRPTEPALRNAVTKILTQVSSYENFNRIKKFTENICNNYLNELQKALKDIGRIGSNQINTGETILTHCHSHSVVEIFKEAKKQGKNFRVIVTETRPLNQGIITAKELLEIGIKVTFCVDAAIGWVMKEVDKVLVGCDAILADGSIVNKIGTFPMALIAERFAVPFFAAGGTYKFDPETVAGMTEPIEHRNPKEVISPRKLKKAEIINPAFDITPADYIRALITEKGIMKPELLRDFVE